MAKAYFYFLLISFICFANSLPNKKNIKEKPLIRFNEDGKFKIVQFSDLHYGESEASVGPENDRKSSGVMRDILKWEKPDFVIFTGDQITGDNLGLNSTEYLHILVKPCVEGNYRWASVYGNHDSGVNLDREELIKAELTYDLTYTQRGPNELPGVSNYYLLVYPPENYEGDKDTPVMIWWFFDSQGGRNPQGSIPEIVDPLVVEWFKVENQRLLDLYGGNLPGLAFFHIPTEEYTFVKPEVGGNPLCAGLNAEPVYDQDYNSGLMDALVDAGNIKTTFVGHDHANAWCCYYTVMEKSIEICYNRHTGYGGYGWWARGARVIDLDMGELGVTQKNYLRMENMDIHSQFPNTV